jgi:hypothetical protein
VSKKLLLIKAGLVSMNVVDANFSKLNQLTNSLSLETDDRILVIRQPV